MKKILVIVFVIVAFVGCIKNPIASVYDDAKRIASDTNSYNLTEVTQQLEGQQLTLKAEQFEGMDTIWKYEAAEDQPIEITYLMNPTDGRIKLVHIGPDEVVTDIVERSSESNIQDYAVSVVRLKKGMNRIKLVGSKGCSVTLEVMIPIGELSTVGMN